MGDPSTGLRYKRSFQSGNPLEKLFNFYRTESKKESNVSVFSANSYDEYSKEEDNKKFKKFVLDNVFHDNKRNKRDVREATKYVETALVLDKAMVRY